MSIWTVLFLLAFVAMIAMHLRGHAGHGGGHGGCGGGHGGGHGRDERPDESHMPGRETSLPDPQPAEDARQPVGAGGSHGGRDAHRHGC